VRTARLPGHLARSVSGVASIYCFFFALAHLRLADAVTLSYSSALFVPIVERLWLKSNVSPRLWGGILLGFLGVMLIVKPGAAAFQPIALVGLSAGLLGAFAQTGIRSLSATEPPGRIVFYFIAVGAALSALPLPWNWQLPSPRAWCQLMLIGLLATYAQLLLTRAYAWASAAQVGPFIYSGALFSAVFDLLLWGRTPDALAGSGAVVIIVASVVVLRSSALSSRRAGMRHQRS
jgi:drug/metabolite transporter (DMT)-like permease